MRSLVNNVVFSVKNINNVPPFKKDFTTETLITQLKNLYVSEIKRPVLNPS